MSYIQVLNNIISDHVTPTAVATDSQSAFPRATIDALGKSGIFGLLSSKEVGGMGLELSDAVKVIETIARECSSTAMIVTMHYSATAIIEKYGSLDLRKKIASGMHLSTLAWSESGSRSHFWAPMGTAHKGKDGYVVNSKKTMVTSALEADSYVWSSKPVTGTGAATLWLVESGNPGLQIPKSFDGLGLRGNASAPMVCENLLLPDAAMLGEDGGGFDIMIGVVLPIFCVLNASCSLGIMDAAMGSAIQHVTGNRFEHLNNALADLPTIRAYLAKAKITTDMVRTLRDDTLVALKGARPDAMLRVMQVKAAAADAALEVTDIGMRVCGGAAFRKELGMERFFRDARAAHVMAPTSDVLFDFIGKAICNMPVFG